MTVPDFLDEPPTGDVLTDYDRAHIKLYMRLLDATTCGADQCEIVKLLFGLDPALTPERARKVHDNHLARARWMTEHGYRQLAKSGEEP